MSFCFAFKVALASIFLSLPFGSIAFAQEVPPTQVELTSELAIEAGKLMKLKISDGREAEGILERVKGDDITIPVDVFESTCSTIQKTKCRYRFSATFDTYSFRWTKNPDANLVGKAIKAEFSAGNSVPIQASLLVTSLAREEYPILAGDFTKQTLECDDYRPFHDATTVPASLFASQWNVEAATVNPETEITENRIDFSYSDVKLDGCEQGLCVASSGEFSSSTPGQRGFLFGDDASSATFVKDPSTGEICQVGFKSSILPTLQKVFISSSAVKVEFPGVVQNSEVLLWPQFNGNFVDSISMFLKPPYLMYVK